MSRQIFFYPDFSADFELSLESQHAFCECLSALVSSGLNRQNVLDFLRGGTTLEVRDSGDYNLEMPKHFLCCWIEESRSHTSSLALASSIFSIFPIYFFIFIQFVFFRPVGEVGEHAGCMWENVASQYLGFFNPGQDGKITLKICSRNISESIF